MSFTAPCPYDGCTGSALIGPFDEYEGEATCGMCKREFDYTLDISVITNPKGHSRWALDELAIAKRQLDAADQELNDATGAIRRALTAEDREAAYVRMAAASRASESAATRYESLVAERVEVA